MNTATRTQTLAVTLAGIVQAVWIADVAYGMTFAQARPQPRCKLRTEDGRIVSVSVPANIQALTPGDRLTVTVSCIGCANDGIFWASRPRKGIRLSAAAVLAEAQGLPARVVEIVDRLSTSWEGTHAEVARQWA